jgi:hypothetical protein
MVILNMRGEFMETVQRKIEIVNGDGKDLEISPVYDHLNIAKPKTKDNEKEKKIIVPEEKKS